MGSLFDVSSSFAQLIIDQMVDVCDIIQESETLDARGQLSPTPTVIAAAVPCSYEPFGMLNFQQLEGSGLLSGHITHKVLMKITTESMQIKQSHVIQVRARDERPLLIFERPQRMDESLSPLLIVGAVLRDQ